MSENVVRVDRDGTVRRDGAPIGRVVKDGRTIGESIMDRPPSLWSAYGADGSTVCSDQARRRDAVRHLDRATRAPAVGDVEIVPGWGWTDAHFYSASVTWDGNYAGVSSYPTEIDEEGVRIWVVDSFTPTGAFMPLFCNGTGSRCTTPRVLFPEQRDLVNAALAASGLRIDPEE